MASGPVQIGVFDLRSFFIDVFLLVSLASLMSIDTDTKHVVPKKLQKPTLTCLHKSASFPIHSKSFVSENAKYRKSRTGS